MKEHKDDDGGTVWDYEDLSLSLFPSLSVGNSNPLRSLAFTFSFLLSPLPPRFLGASLSVHLGPTEGLTASRPQTIAHKKEQTCTT